MMPVYVFHEPIDVKEVMGDIEPGIEDKHVDEDLFY
jgi:hypothetical protein